MSKSARIPGYRKSSVAHQAIPREEAYDYERVQVVILHPLELAAEHYQRLLIPWKWKDDWKPWNLMQLLKDLLNKWVPPKKTDRATLTDQILLEQFV